MQKFAFIEGLSCAGWMPTIGGLLGGVGGMLPQGKFSSVRISEVNSDSICVFLYECVQSLLASPFPCAARGVAKSQSQRRLARTGESVHRLDDRNY